MHVEAVGILSCSVPAFWIQKGGSKSWEEASGKKVTEILKITLKPRRGGLEQLVTNFRRDLFCSSLSPSTTCQKAVMVGWVSS